MTDNKTTGKKAVLEKMGDSIKRGEEAVADVARDALDGAADLHTDADYKPPQNQTWAKEVEGKVTNDPAREAEGKAQNKLGGLKQDAREVRDKLEGRD